MADFNWPTALEPTSFEASLVPNVRQLSSPLSGAGQVLDLVGERWRFTVGLPQSARSDSGALEAYLNKLKGGANRALLWHMARPTIGGSLVSTATLNGAHAQGAASLLLAGAYPSNNFLRFVEQFDNAAWTKSGSTAVTANATTAPDGNATADKLIENSTASTTFNAAQSAGSFTAGQSATFSVYVKAAERTQAMVRILAGGAFGTTAFVYTDLSAGTITLASGVTASSIVAAGNGWYRVSITATASGSGAASCAVFPAVGGTNTYTGVIGNGIFVWGAQLEQAGAASAYTPLANLDAGDMIGLSGMLLQVSDDATADTAGAMTVPLVTRLRKAVTGGTGLTLTKPTAAFRPVDTGGIVVGHAGRIVREVSIEFLEDY